jgi:hypothetical protein
MVRILYEHPMEWPDEGPLQVDANLKLTGEIPVSPEPAVRRANGYLGEHVAMAVQASDPVLVWSERPRWRLQANLYLRGLGRVATLGSLEVDAMTREVTPLSEADIIEMQSRAHAIALRPSLTTAPGS